MKTYEEYKDSGVEWIGEIPAHWDVKPLRRLVREHSGYGFPVNLQGDKYGTVPFLKVSDFSSTNRLIKSSTNYVSEKTIKIRNWKKVPAGSLVTAKIGEALRKNHRNILAVNSLIDNNCIAFEPIGLDLFFCYYMHRIIDFDWFVNPGAVPSISVSKYKSLKVSLPPLSEQTAIAEFLDGKTAKIDSLVEIKQRQIELLKERKQILIQNAVTKGLDPNAPMKDSGVEWIGEIPAHWEVKKFRYLFDCCKGLAISKENLQDKGVPCVNYGEIHSKYAFELDSNIYQLKSVSCDYLKTSKNSLLNFGDFIFADTSEDLEGSGNFAYLNCKYQVFAGYHTVIARPKFDAGQRYTAYFFESLSYRGQMRQQVKGVKVFSITQAILKGTQIVRPPLSEQIKITEFLDEQSQKIDTAISIKEEQIEKLNEYKTVLINAAVTGKIKVAQTPTPRNVEVTV